jgi:hypothetical protein
LPENDGNDNRDTSSVPAAAADAAERGSAHTLMMRFARTAAARLAALTDSAVGQARSGW